MGGLSPRQRHIDEVGVLRGDDKPMVEREAKDGAIGSLLKADGLDVDGIGEDVGERRCQTR